MARGWHLSEALIMMLLLIISLNIKECRFSTAIATDDSGHCQIKNHRLIQLDGEEKTVD